MRNQHMDREIDQNARRPVQIVLLHKQNMLPQAINISILLNNCYIILNRLTSKEVKQEENPRCNIWDAFFMKYL